MLNKAFTQRSFVHECMIACVPSKLKLEAIEAPEEIRHQMKMLQMMPNDCSMVDVTLPAIERRWRIPLNSSVTPRE